MRPQAGDKGLRLSRAEGGVAAIVLPFGDHPRRVVSLVIVEVSSIEISRDNALLKKHRRRRSHSSRVRAIFGR